MLCEFLKMLTKTKFRTQFERIRIISNPGERFEEERIGKRNPKTGIVEVIPTGKKIDLYSNIQSYADSVDINKMIEKFQAGDPNALGNPNYGQFLDLTKLPTNYNDLLNTMANGERLFNSLDIKTKEKFNNNFDEFVSTIGQPDWYDKLKLEKIGKVKDEPIKVVEEKNE